MNLQKWVEVRSNEIDSFEVEWKQKHFWISNHSACFSCECSVVCCSPILFGNQSNLLNCKHQFVQNSLAPKSILPTSIRASKNYKLLCLVMEVYFLFVSQIKYNMVQRWLELTPLPVNHKAICHLIILFPFLNFFAIQLYLFSVFYAICRK